MIEAGQDAGLGQKGFGTLRSTRPLRVAMPPRQLDGNVSMQLRVVGFVNDSKTAAAQFGFDLIPTQGRRLPMRAVIAGSRRFRAGGRRRRRMSPLQRRNTLGLGRRKLVTGILRRPCARKVFAEDEGDGLGVIREPALVFIFAGVLAALRPIVELDGQQLAKHGATVSFRNLG
jgi:hypothetical protein